jgi:hypothetical protein
LLHAVALGGGREVGVEALRRFNLRPLRGGKRTFTEYRLRAEFDPKADPPAVLDIGLQAVQLPERLEETSRD